MESFFWTYLLVSAGVYCVLPATAFFFLLMGFGLRSETQRGVENNPTSLWVTFLILGFVTLACAIGGILWIVL
jgi:hypothetical protein